MSGCGDARVAPPCPTACVCGKIYLTLPWFFTHRSPTRTGPCTLNAVGLLSLDVEMRGLRSPLAPPPRVCGEVYLTLPYLGSCGVVNEATSLKSHDGGRPSGASASPHGPGMHPHTLLSRMPMRSVDGGRGAATLQRCDRTGLPRRRRRSCRSRQLRCPPTRWYARSPDPVRGAEARALVPGEPPDSKTAPLPASPSLASVLSSP